MSAERNSEFHLFSSEELRGVLEDAGIVEPLQEKITTRMQTLSMQEAMNILLNRLPKEELAELEKKGAERFEEEIRRDVELDFVAILDIYLSEVSRRVYGVNLADLSPNERLQIIGVRKDLDLPGEFDPDA